MEDRSTVFESDENVLVLFHDFLKDQCTVGEPLLLCDLSPLELLEHGVVLIDGCGAHYREEYRDCRRTSQQSSLESSLISRRETQ